ncbi:DUF4965 domain-containing protein [Alsobacter sp. SYSU M60028]|uniref:DUF4965 domain-containing protein n=1 Tax=Alsobacter ponti TaxID=2962936 RepID=A0ABT1LDS3_9HYPH|nr:DUF4965 domain-containing protein [Alsobacter ponti]MCP8939655.1 DUF4965 domain-containing protein [Alsobacter ponti]
MPATVTRPPAIPLVTIDPHTSVWCFADRLTDDWPRHWTGSKMALYGVVRVDGVAYRFLGGDEWLARAATQTSCVVEATRTVAQFRCGAVELEVEFLTPLLVDDLDLLSRPVTYLRTAARGLDGRPHRIEVYVDMTGEWAVNLPHERVYWDRCGTDKLAAASLRSENQAVLAACGDHRRIDWGRAFLAGPAGDVVATVGDIDISRDSFVQTGRASEKGLKTAPRKVDYNADAVMALTFDLSVEPGEAADQTVMVAYDDEWSIELFHRRLRPWWRRNGLEALPMLEQAWAERETVRARAIAFEAELRTRAVALGGEGYASLLALTWRHALAAHKLAEGPSGEPLLFSKENFSNGCIATVDVTYPSAPLFLAYNPSLIRAMLDPYFPYCSGPDWPYPFAAHDLGTYPLANGQTYRNWDKDKTQDIVETQMPVEECGNMLILVGALTRAEGRADYARQHWTLLTQWADYLVETGYNPGDQLCTDDFSGVLGHNVNLSGKAAMGLACYAMMAGMLGHAEEASRYRGVAEEFARHILNSRDGDGTRLAFDQPGSWSIKYNLVWDRLLGLDVFPQEEMRRELAFYRTKVELYGLPLDNRGTITKPEWMLWAASLADDREFFEDCVERIVRYANETRNRVPMSDLYLTDSGRKIGFQARSVVGGLFIRFLEEWATPRG